MNLILDYVLVIYLLSYNCILGIDDDMIERTYTPL